METVGPEIAFDAWTDRDKTDPKTANCSDTIFFIHEAATSTRTREAAEKTSYFGTVCFTRAYWILSLAVDCLVSARSASKDRAHQLCHLIS